MNKSDWQRRIGVGERQAPPPQGATRVRPVVADDGPLRGRTVGQTRDHGDGRRDAIAHQAVITARPLTARRTADGQG